MSAHTPGPWTYPGFPQGRVEHANGGHVATAVRRFRLPTVDANGRLIAAAPDLLSALEACVHLAERDYAEKQSTEFAAGAHSRLTQVRAALAKAKGTA